MSSVFIQLARHCSWLRRAGCWTIIGYSVLAFLVGQVDYCDSRARALSQQVHSITSSSIRSSPGEITCRPKVPAEKRTLCCIILDKKKIDSSCGGLELVAKIHNRAELICTSLAAFSLVCPRPPLLVLVLVTTFLVSPHPSQQPHSLWCVCTTGWRLFSLSLNLQPLGRCC